MPSGTSICPIFANLFTIYWDKILFKIILYNITLSIITQQNIKKLYSSINCNVHCVHELPKILKKLCFIFCTVGKKSSFDKPYLALWPFEILLRFSVQSPRFFHQVKKKTYFEIRKKVFFHWFHIQSLDESNTK